MLHIIEQNLVPVKRPSQLSNSLSYSVMSVGIKQYRLACIL